MKCHYCFYYRPTSRLVYGPYISRRCLICNKSSAKYRCPRCAARTCSVDCVKEHKTQQNCSGVRDKTAFVGIKQFNDGTLLSGTRESHYALCNNLFYASFAFWQKKLDQ